MTHHARVMPLVFLDIDDVLCMSSPYGGYDALHVVGNRHPRPDDVCKHLFVEGARHVLEQVHMQMHGCLNYVISSTWREHFDRTQLTTVLSRGGLGFVAEALLEGERWRTPSKCGRSRRVDEIAQWLDQHHAGQPFVILDDTFSGPSLAPALTNPNHPFAGRVILCKENVGLAVEHVEAILKALRHPARPLGGTEAEPQQQGSVVNQGASA